MTCWDIIEGGLYGLLVGDACGVPYEFRQPYDLPPKADLEMIPPKGFIRSYAYIKPGTWSDDGAQALCLLKSMLECGGFHGQDFANRLVRWHDKGYMAVNGYVFDIGNQTSVSIKRLQQGTTIEYSGMRGERNNGNGSLMRCLPLALLFRGSDSQLVSEAHQQSRITHAHPRSLVCCALYCLWARREMEKSASAWEDAVATLREIYRDSPLMTKELNEHVRPDAPAYGTGSGYVVDALHSARMACLEESYEAIIKTAISLGNDTDTTACIAGGIAGIRHGKAGIPGRWLATLQGQQLLAPIMKLLEEQVRWRTPGMRLYSSPEMQTAL